MCKHDNFNFGYACLNTHLRKKGIFSSRTLRLATLEKRGINYAKQLATQNLKDLLEILKWNKENGIFFFRISSELFPFATYTKPIEGFSSEGYTKPIEGSSSEGYTKPIEGFSSEGYTKPIEGFSSEFQDNSKGLYSLDFADDILKEIGDYSKRHGIRLTMHPAQFCVLSSKSEDVVKNAFGELNHHCEILDRMGLGKDSVIIIHGGGVYGDKKKALKRLEENIVNLPKNTRERLVLENCEMSYTVEDLLPVSEKLSVPIVIDYHHDSIYGSTGNIQYYYERVFNVWISRGIKPKVHVSNSVPGVNIDDSKTARRKHSDYIQFLHPELLLITFPIDVMLECKMKEAALLKFRHDIIN